MALQGEARSGWAAGQGLRAGRVTQSLVDHLEEQLGQI